MNLFLSNCETYCTPQMEDVGLPDTKQKAMFERRS